MHTQLFIDGQWCPADSGEALEVFNPADSRHLADVAAAGAADVDRAVAAARCAYQTVWRRVDPMERGRIMRRIAGLIRDRAEALALLDTRDGGRPIRDTRRDLVRASDLFDFYGGMTEKLRGATLPVPDGYLAYTRREPYGVVAAIIPWNLPLVNACLKVAPALAAGNVVVLKPAEQTPLSALALAAICQEAGVPDGVLNVVPGYGETAGAALAAHHDVDKIAFTGSTEVGRKIMQAASGNIKGLTLELGGKAPNIVFADADLEAAAQGALFTVYAHQGQICAAGTRLLVERKIEAQFLDMLVDKATRLKIGHPENPEVHVGALISGEHYERVVGYVAQGLGHGAQLLIGGARLTDGTPAGGHYFQPTIFTGVNPSMSIAREEIFGPVLAVMSFGDEAEAIALANQTIYGLTAAVWTRDLARAHRMAAEVRAGTVWLNMINLMNVAVPAGGHGQSGLGNEYGIEGAEAYTRLKTVWVNQGERPVGWGL